MTILLVNIKRINFVRYITALARASVVIFVFVFSHFSRSEPAAIPSINPPSITIGCSDWKPYCYSDQGTLTGSAHQLIKQVLQHNNVKFEKNIDYSFAYIPWNRIYRLTLKNENTFIVGLGRTRKRETLFNWVVPLRKPTKVYAYLLKSSNILLDKPADLLNYRIAVERGSFTEDYLVELGYKKENILTVSRMDQLLKMALHKRIDGFLLDEKIFAFESQKNKIDPRLFTKALFAFEVTEYLATNKKTPIETVNQIQRAYTELINKKEISLLD